MDFVNSFDVAAPIDEVFNTILDVERVAPCVPGAEVLERTGEDAYKVAIKVRVGPMSMQYRGNVEIVDTDPAEHSATMRARAREARGQGAANADVAMQLAEEDGRTRGTIRTQVQLSGRAASMGRGIIQDVSARIVDQFADNLAAMLTGPPEVPAAEEPAAPAAAAAPAASAPASPAEPPRAVPQEPAAAVTPAPSAAADSAAAAEPKAPGAGPPPAAARESREGAGAALSATDLAGAVIAGRLRDPRVLAGALAAAAALGFALGRRSAG